MHDDDYTQATVFSEFAKQHPARLALDEITLRMRDRLSETDAEAGDSIQLALLELERDGLVRAVGTEYTLTRPAARLAEFPDVD